ncbi:MAG: hypothetical protein CL917_03835 [Deltaproteobacteria bacterium]|nr:hypothetical protein [Deltaproteobacteria bacterium]
MAKRRFSGRSFAGRLFLLLLGVVLGVSIAEGLLRLSGYEPRIHVVYRENFRLSENPKLQYELQPGSIDGQSRISQAGLRDREFAIEKAPGTYRIMIIGDSVAYGLRVKADQAFPKQLEGLLGDLPHDDVQFEVLNLGVSGYNTQQSVERLRVLGLSYRPDLIIYAYSLNDPQTFSLESQGLAAMEERARRELRPGESILRGLSRSRLFLLLWRSFQDPWTQGEVHAQGSPDYQAVVSGSYDAYFEALHRGETWNDVKDGLLILKELGEETGARTWVALLPIQLGRGRVAPLSSLRARLQEEVTALGLFTLDLGPPMIEANQNDSKQLFRDPFHPTPEGHRILAESLYGALLESDFWDQTMNPLSAQVRGNSSEE